MHKKRILFSGETTHALSGFGKYGREVLGRLHATDKYELAEHASYGKLGNPLDINIPWIYYPNEVREDDPRKSMYDAIPANQWGQWRFERVCLDFKPDVVFDIRDPWMLYHTVRSPLRPYYHLALMPTVDSSPQKEEWIDWFLHTDSVFSYTDWGLEVLQKEGQGRINTVDSAPPGVDTDVYCPVNDKKEVREGMGIMPDCYIVGTIMRNQRRKLYPDLIQSFKMFLDKCKETGRKDLAENTYLYCHTSYPDNGWDIPKLIANSGIGHKILFSYLCQSCNNPYCSFFSGPKAVCHHCNHAQATLPSVGHGFSERQLAQVLQCMDLYVQYAICEGFGMPQVEAAACGVPVAATDYSAMEDVVRKVQGFPIKVAHKFLEFETSAYRVYPCNVDCSEIIYNFLSKPSPVRKVIGHKARQAVLEHYTWDRTAKIWEDHFDSIELTGKQGKWDSPANLPSSQTFEQIPQGLSNSEFVKYLCEKVVCDPDLFHRHVSLEQLANLNYGLKKEGHKKIQPVTKKGVYKFYKLIAENILLSEQARTGMVEMRDEDFIQYARERR